MGVMSGIVVLRAGEARAPLVLTVVSGLLIAATVAQMVLLDEVAEVVARVLQSGDGLECVGRPLALLLGAMVARPAFVWLREVVALRDAERAKRRVRERLLIGKHAEERTRLQ